MPQLLKESRTLNLLKKTKNLLAFSGGIDSTSLFYLLIENGIEFDLSIVDYNTRKSSKDEVAYALYLAKKYNKKCFLKSVNLDSSNFEASARDVRYSFFKKIIEENSYEVLLTAHHLGDKLEWFFMQLVRGVGSVELSGFSCIEQRENYKIVRPLHETSKDELLDYLQKNSYNYFIDDSNFDEKHERNYFRKNFAEPLLAKYKGGIARTFKALEKDKSLLLKNDFEKLELLYFFKRDANEMRLISKILKFFKIVLSTKQREEIEKNSNLVISGKIAIGKNREFVFIAPYLQDVVMTKKFKERCRIDKIPLHVRSYMFKSGVFPKL